MIWIMVDCFVVFIFYVVMVFMMFNMGFLVRKG